MKFNDLYEGKVVTIKTKEQLIKDFGSYAIRATATRPAIVGDMVQYLGRKAKINYLEIANSGYSIVQLDADRGMWNWHPDFFVEELTPKGNRIK